MFGAGWYLAGLAAGIAVGLGVLLSGLFAGSRPGPLAAAVAGALGGGLIGAFAWGWPEGVTGAVGGALGALGAAEIVHGALRRGGTRGGTLALVAVGAVLLAALALVPIVGYLEAAVVPGLAARLRRRAGRSYAGLRILARD